MDLLDIKGIGPKKKKSLQKLDIETPEDLLEHFPFRFENRKDLKKLEDISDGESALVKVEMTTGAITRFLGTRKSVTKAEATDGITKLTMTWFHMPYIKNQIKNGMVLYIFGTFQRKHRIMEIVNPIFDSRLGHELGIIYPIYSTVKGLTSNDIGKWIIEVYQRMQLPDVIPENIRRDYELLHRKDAIRILHRPNNLKEYQTAKRTFQFEEALITQLALQFHIEIEQATQFHDDIRLERFINQLPFSLTGAQKRVFQEINQDMNAQKPMNRLVQGDVGSGKTIISILAMYKAYLNGYQSVLMAPTEILATQHFHTLNRIFSEYGMEISLLKGSMTKKQKETTAALLKLGHIDMLVTTHAVLEDYVTFDRLGLVITDEQHRFGVEQRAKISSKGNMPDTLVMSATPIPRTLALTLFSDLDVSTVDELPPGRMPIDTIVITPKYEKRMIDFMKKEIQKGRQVYIVTPLIEDSETMDLNSVLTLYHRLQEEYFQDIPTAFLHGRMSAKEKDALMQQFVENTIQVLFSTTVIEVGVDVPNANIIAIYNAERFGLSQLHQLRGRVGRGNYKSYCILMNMSQSKTARQRMQIMQTTDNGLELATQDMKMRGYGDIFGTRQSGVPMFKMLDPVQDLEILETVHPHVKQIIRLKLLDSPKCQILRQAVLRKQRHLNRKIILN